MRIAIATVVAVALIAGGAAPGLAKAKRKSDAFQINSTSWEFTDKDGAQQESIGPDGKYVVHAGAKHIDHGTAVMKDGKACFTSAMTKGGEECWTTKPVAIGGSMDTTSDKGKKLTVKRVRYTPPKM